MEIETLMEQIQKGCYGEKVVSHLVAENHYFCQRLFPLQENRSQNW